MADKLNILQIALRTFDLEARSIKGLGDFINEDFEKVVRRLAELKGRLVVSGIGKSALIGQKIVATLNSTGTASIFMHAADAIHGDLGMIRDQDAVMVISKSGNSPEIRVLVPLIRDLGNPLIAMVGNMDSFLARNSDHQLNTTIDHEACPNNLAPTTSTTAQMVMGDALAVCLMELKGFSPEDFARFHPGGTLGKKLYLQVGDLSTQHEKPKVKEGSSLKQVIMEITEKRLGVTAVMNDQEELSGVITDGDLRRMLEKGGNLDRITAADIMTRSPKTIEADTLAVVALEKMRNSDITQLLVTEKGKYVGAIHLHDLLREGLI
jgi:arabinose-5-phosphate isomerase